MALDIHNLLRALKEHQAEQCNIAAQLQNFLGNATKVIGGST